LLNYERAAQTVPPTERFCLLNYERVVPDGLASRTIQTMPPTIQTVPPTQFETVPPTQFAVDFVNDEKERFGDAWHASPGWFCVDIAGLPLAETTRGYLS
jgi:hypothetical protein